MPIEAKPETSVEDLLPLLRNAAQQIESQRRAIASLEPQAEAYQALLKVLGFLGSRQDFAAMETGVAWHLRDQIERIENARADRFSAEREAEAQAAREATQTSFIGDFNFIQPGEIPDGLNIGKNPGDRRIHQKIRGVKVSSFVEGAVPAEERLEARLASPVDPKYEF